MKAPRIFAIFSAAGASRRCELRNARSLAAVALCCLLGASQVALARHHKHADNDNNTPATETTTTDSEKTKTETDQTTDDKAKTDADQQSGDKSKATGNVAIPTGAETPSGKDAGKSSLLHGSAEMNAVKNKNYLEYQGSTLYKKGATAINGGSYRSASDFFRQSATQFEQAGDDKYQAQALFAQAQAERLLGHAQQAGKLYQAAIDLFNEYDPLSPYLKPALDNLKQVAPNLSGRVARDEARLKALQTPDRIMTVDRNVLLKGGLSEYGSSALMEEKATQDVPKDYVDKTIHKAFVRMTCLETAELGSNYITAENRWFPLIAHGKTVTISASSTFMAPMINVKINEHRYNVAVDLPDLGPTKRTVFLLTDGMHIVAIDPSTEDMWSLVADFKGKKPSFNWKKLSHFKPKRKTT